MIEEKSWYEVEVRLAGVHGPAYMTDKEMLDHLNEKLSALGFVCRIAWAAIESEETDGYE